jgi:hypothetical protein
MIRQGRAELFDADGRTHGYDGASIRPSSSVKAPNIAAVLPLCSALLLTKGQTAKSWKVDRIPLGLSLGEYIGFISRPLYVVSFQTVT